MDTKAYANFAADKPFQPYSFVRRSPGPTDVAIDIKFCGICHSDIHTARSEWGPAFYPCVPGHEIVGTVKSIGKNVGAFKVGDTVGIGCLVGSCQNCSSCREGLEQFCENGFVGTYNSPLPDGDYTKGGYSSHIVVDEKFVLKIPKNLDLAGTAPLLCAGITTYSPLKHLEVNTGSRVGILGLGGLGHMGVKLAASMGAEVTVISHSEHKRNDAKRLGAHEFLLSSNSEELGKRSNYFDVIIDTVSAQHSMSPALNLVKRDGTLVLVGASEKPLAVDTFPLILARRSIMGSLIGGIKETQEMLDHCGKHNIVSDIELISANQINVAYERILKSDVKYRFVINCATL